MAQISSSKNVISFLEVHPAKILQQLLPALCTNVFMPNGRVTACHKDCRVAENVYKGQQQQFSTFETAILYFTLAAHFKPCCHATRTEGKTRATKINAVLYGNTSAQKENDC